MNHSTLKAFYLIIVFFLTMLVAVAQESVPDGGGEFVIENAGNCL